MFVVRARPPVAAATAGCAGTAASAAGEAVSLSSTSSATAPLRECAGARSGRVGQQHPALTDGIGQVAHHADGRVPADAGVGDAHAVGERLPGKQILAPGVDVALDHRADDPAIAAADLGRDVLRDFDLPFVLFLAVRVRAVDHDARGQTGVAELGADA